MSRKFWRPAPRSYSPRDIQLSRTVPLADAHVWRGAIRDAALRSQLLTEPHLAAARATHSGTERRCVIRGLRREGRRQAVRQAGRPGSHLASRDIIEIGTRSMTRVGA